MYFAHQIQYSCLDCIGIYIDSFHDYVNYIITSHLFYGLCRKCLLRVFDAFAVIKSQVKYLTVRYVKIIYNWKEIIFTYMRFHNKLVEDFRIIVNFYNLVYNSIVQEMLLTFQSI